jgi:signal transduction histidine kinase
VWLAGLLLCVLGGFGSAVYQLERAARFSRLDDDLTVRIAALNNALRNAPSSRGPVSRSGPARRPPRPLPPGVPRGLSSKPAEMPVPAAAAALFGDAPGDFYYVIWYRDDTVLARSAAAPGDVPAPPSPEHDTLTHWRMRDGLREAYHCSGLGDCVLAGRSAASGLASLRTLALALLGVGVAVLAIALGAGWWLTGRAIRPIDRIAQAASRISRGNLSERIDVSGRQDELGRLAAVLNATFDRLEAAFERQRRFTADAAHELRTPLAVIISEAQTALARPRAADEYQETVEGCLETAQQMRRLTESLLTLSRFDADDTFIPRSEIDLRDVVLAALERVRPLADGRCVSMESCLAAALAFSNHDRLAQAVTNLLTNAIDYNRPGGKVCVSTSTEHGSAIVAVTDTGTGIAPEDLPYIFDRFYRADKARSRADGHTGLGLSICKTVMEAEGGTIEVTSTLQVGTTFTIRMPSIKEPRHRH